MSEKKQLPALLGYALRGERVPAACVPEDWQALLSLASRHKVLSTLAAVMPLLPERPSEEVARALEGCQFQQILISSNQLHGWQQLQAGFESRGIYNMALKGIHTKQRYPQDYMRSMGDMDILCKPEQNAMVRDAMEALGYGNFEPGRKHDHYSYPPYLAVEMHRQMVAASSEFSQYYEGVWQRSHPLDGCKYSYAMSPEDEYLYTLIHLTEHYRNGGVGIRFLMDVYVYETAVTLDKAYLMSQLQKLKLDVFYANVVKLAMHWFAGEEADELIGRMAEYVYSGGLYGSVKNAQANAVSKGGKVRFLLRACFPRYTEMCSMYPWLKKCPIALPVAWIMRGAGSLLHRRGNVRSQLATYAKADADHGKQLQAFYRDCGL